MKKSIIPNPNFGFIPIGIKPNVSISKNVFETYTIKVYDNNFVLVDNTLLSLIESLSLEILFPYEYKSLPGKEFDLRYNDLSYKIDHCIYTIDDLFLNCLDRKQLFPIVDITEDKLFYLKLANASITFMD